MIGNIVALPMTIARTVDRKNNWEIREMNKFADIIKQNVRGYEIFESAT